MAEPTALNDNTGDAQPGQDPEWTAAGPDCAKPRCPGRVSRARPDPRAAGHRRATRAVERLRRILDRERRCARWTNFGWNLTTACEHAGWPHATTNAGPRLNR